MVRSTSILENKQTLHLRKPRARRVTQKCREKDF
jgi:hypothetical protein